MAFDGFVTKAIITELNNNLIGAKVNKVLQPTKSEIILELYVNGKNYSLLLSCDSEFCRIGLTKYSKPNPQNALNFCMLLRKYLVGGKILEISNYDLERTVQIKFSCYNELNDLVTRKLYIEIMSRQSNIVLTNENNIIIDSIKHFDTSTREMLPAHEYEFVPIAKKSFIELENTSDFINLIPEDSILSKSLPNLFIGFSKTFVNLLLQRLKIYDTNFSHTDLTNLYNTIKEIISNFGTSKISAIQFGNDFTIANTETSELLQINNFIDDYYFFKEQNTHFQTAKNNLLHIVLASLKKITKKLENINQKLKECNNMDKYKLYGELLTANLYKINSSYNLSEIEVENYYDNNNLIKIPLDKSVSVHKNIDKFFKKYNKLKNALIIVSEQKKETEKELDYIESIVFSLENAKSLKDINEIYEEISENIVTKKNVSNKKQNNLRKKQKNSSEHELTSIEFENYTIYIGKNNIQNDYLRTKVASPNDIWFHAQKIHGSHIILKNSKNLPIEDIPETVLFECAKLAKENCKSELSLNVPIDYCYVKYVKKAPGAKPGMVIYSNFQTIIVK